MENCKKIDYRDPRKSQVFGWIPSF